MQSFAHSVPRPARFAKAKKSSRRKIIWIGLLIGALWAFYGFLPSSKPHTVSYIVSSIADGKEAEVYGSYGRADSGKSGSFDRKTPFKVELDNFHGAQKAWIVARTDDKQPPPVRVRIYVDGKLHEEQTIAGTQNQTVAEWTLE